MPGDDVVGEKTKALQVSPGRKELKRSDPDMACGYSGENGPRKFGFPGHGFSGHDGGERSCGRDAQRGHRLAHNVFAQHWSQRCPAIAASGKRSGPRALELDIAPDAVPVDNLAKQDGTTVAELRHKMSKLVSGVSQGNRLRRIRDPLPRQHLESLGTDKPFRIEPKVDRELCVQADQPRAPAPVSARPGHKTGRAAAHRYSQTEGGRSLDRSET